MTSRLDFDYLLEREHGHAALWDHNYSDTSSSNTSEAGSVDQNPGSPIGGNVVKTEYEEGEDTGTRESRIGKDVDGNPDHDHNLCLLKEQRLMGMVTGVQRENVQLKSDLRDRDRRIAVANEVVQAKETQLKWVTQENRELKKQLEKERLERQEEKEGAQRELEETVHTLKTDAELKCLRLESKIQVLQKDLTDETNRRRNAQEELCRLKTRTGVSLENRASGRDEKVQPSTSRSWCDQAVAQNLDNHQAIDGEEDDEVVVLQEVINSPRISTSPRVKQSLNATQSTSSSAGRELVPSGKGTCTVCGATFSNDWLLKMHVYENHNNNRPKFQNVVKRIGGSRKVIRKPNPSSTITRPLAKTKLPFSCRNCSESFERVSQLLVHRRRKHKIAPEGFLIGCGRCGTVFTSRKEHARHRIEVHGYRTPLPMKKTGKKGTKSRLAPKRKVVVKNQVSLVNSDDLGKEPTTITVPIVELPTTSSPNNSAVPSSSTSRRKHGVDLNNVNPDQNCLCGEQFDDIKVLLRHVRMEAAIEEGTIDRPSADNSNWQVCTRSRQSEEAEEHLELEDVQRHVYVGQNQEGRFLCACGAFYDTRGVLYKHCQLKNTGKIFQCEWCGKRFDKHRGLKNHVESVHDAVYGAGDYACGRCAMTFFTWQELLRHRKVHQHQ